MDYDAHIDFETRSRVDIEACGSSRYAIDESTEIFMASVSRSDSDRVILWVNPKFATPDFMGEDNKEAEDILAGAKRRYAHNSAFETAITWGVDARKGTSPFARPPDLSSWRCTAAMARRAGLPSSLDAVGDALKLPIRKDREGYSLILFFCVPQKNGKFNEPKDHPEKWVKFCNYCITDTRVEKLVHHKLKAWEMEGFPLAAFQFDQRMNMRGIPLNVPAARNAKKIILQVEGEVRQEFHKLTGLNPSQVKKLTSIFKLPNMQAETVENEIVKCQKLLADPLVPEDDEQWKATKSRLHLLTLYQKQSYAATKKIHTFLDWVCPDGRMRGVHNYYGAGTGRSSASGPQCQNVKKAPENLQDFTPFIYRQISRSPDAECLSEVYGEPLDVISATVRHFIHDPKQKMLNGDYNAVEARIACWRAGQLDILEDWKNGKDLYRRAAAFVYRISEDDIPKKSAKRSFGKVCELAGQFGQGTHGFLMACNTWGVECDEALAKRAIYEYYRPTHPKIVSRWYIMDDQARAAIAHPGSVQGQFTVRTIAGIKYLLMKLPSGRSICYPHIEINRREPTAKEKEEMKKGKNYPDKRFLEISYWGRIQGKTWGRVKIHGAVFFQNDVQATAADFITHGAITAEARGMEPFMLIHDEACAFSTTGKHTPEDFEKALGDLPTWARGMPLKVETQMLEFYTK